MKNLITLSVAFMLASGFTVPDKKAAVYPDSIKSGKYILSFTKIVIEDDIDVTLLESPEKAIDIAGSQKYLSGVEWKIKNGTLHISSNQGSLKNKVLVTLNVQGLKEIKINGESTVKSLGNINSPSLDVFLNDMGYVSISNAGKINVMNGHGIRLDIKKKTANVSVLSSEL